MLGYSDLKQNTMVTKKQYDAAKKVVTEYETQNRKHLQKTFTVADLDIVSYSIGVPCLSEDIVGESFAVDLSNKIEQQGVNVDFISLDDFGYISIAFREMELKDLHINAVLNALNSE